MALEEKLRKERLQNNAGVGEYLAQINKIPLLSKEEEKEVTQKIFFIRAEYRKKLFSLKPIIGYILESFDWLDKGNPEKLVKENAELRIKGEKASNIIKYLDEIKKLYGCEKSFSNKKFYELVEKLNLNHEFINGRISNKLKDLQTSDELEKIKDLQKQYFDNQNKLYNSNLRLVICIAKSYRRNIVQNKMPFIDLICTGNSGLERAIEKFDPSRNCKFSTYATGWIHQKIRRYIKESIGKMHIGHSTIDRAQLYKATIEDLSKRFERKPFIDEIIIEFKKRIIEKDLEKSLGKKPIEKQIIEGLRKNRFKNIDEKYIFELENKLKTPIEFTYLKDSLQEKNDGRNDFIEEDERKFLRKKLFNAIRKSLDKRETAILKERYGFNEEKTSKTLEQVSEKLNLSKERVRQIEKDALKKIRKQCINW